MRPDWTILKWFIWEIQKFIVHQSAPSSISRSSIFILYSKAKSLIWWTTKNYEISLSSKIIWFLASHTHQHDQTLEVWNPMSFFKGKNGKKFYSYIKLVIILVGLQACNSRKICKLYIRNYHPKIGPYLKYETSTTQKIFTIIQITSLNSIHCTIFWDFR